MAIKREPCKTRLMEHSSPIKLVDHFSALLKGARFAKSAISAILLEVPKGTYHQARTALFDIR